MFTQKLTACLVGLACLAVATTSCKKQSTFSADGLPYKASVKGAVWYVKPILGTATYAPVPNATVSLEVTVGGNYYTTLTKQTDGSGNYEFTNIPVAANWNATTPNATTVKVTVSHTTVNGDLAQPDAATPTIHPGVLQPNVTSIVDTVKMTQVIIAGPRP